MKKLSEAALKARRKYFREYARERRKNPENVKHDKVYHKKWRKEHPENVKNHNISFWEKQASKISVTNNVTDSVTDKICVICGKPFTSRRKDSKYCGPACKQKHYRSGK